MTATVKNADGTWSQQPIAVLVSGGPDSAILVAELAKSSPRVVPIYVRFGMVWEDAEEHALREFLRALAAPAVASLKVFQLPIDSVYGNHWSLTGEQVPDAASPDAAVFLPGRNLLLLAQAAIWCHLQGIATIAMGLLKGNPFPDSREAFFASFEATFNAALESKIRIVRPFGDLSKIEVLQRGRSLPLALTWSCMQPREGLQCGRCNKCAERQKAFAAAGMTDSTRYVAQAARL